MKLIRWTKHAEINAAKRELDRRVVETTVKEPQFTAEARGERRVFMRLYHDEVLDTQMLCRVVIEETEDEIVIITVYKTSQIHRYVGEDKR